MDRVRFSLYKLNKGTSVYSLQRGRVFQAAVECNYNNESKSKKHFQLGVRIGFSCAAVRLRGHVECPLQG